MSYLRLWTVFEEYFSKDTKQSFTISDANLGGGVTGKKILRISDEDVGEDELQTIFAEEEASDREGKPFRFKSINAKKLREFPLYWYIEVSSQERENGALDKAMFQDRMNQGMMVAKVTGRQMKPDVLIESYERTWKAKGLFEKNAPVAVGAVGMGPQSGGAAVMAEGGQGMEERGGSVQADAQKLMNEIEQVTTTETSDKVKPKLPGRPTFSEVASR